MGGGGLILMYDFGKFSDVGDCPVLPEQRESCCIYIYVCCVCVCVRVCVCVHTMYLYLYDELVCKCKIGVSDEGRRGVVCMRVHGTV